MKIAWLVVVLASMLLATPLAAQEKKEHPAHDELRAVKKKLVDAVNTNDLETLLSLLDDDVVVTWQNAEVSRGPKQVREYYDKMMKGPNKIVDTIKIDPTVDDLSHLYGDATTAVAYGGSKDRYKLSDGRDFVVESRWSATAVKRGGQWKIASFHASANMFDNPVMWIALRKGMTWTGIGAGALGLLLGVIVTRFIGRRRQSKP
jgi:uncharacterized protein (TIGR02246 family)